MKLLFDHNLSHHLVRSLADLFPDLSHVKTWNLDKADDAVVWEFARKGGYTIVSKDSDFRQMSFLLSFPPKVIWVRLGNCTTDDIEQCLRRSHPKIGLFVVDDEASLLILD